MFEQQKKIFFFRGGFGGAFAAPKAIIGKKQNSADCRVKRVNY